MSGLDETNIGKCPLCESNSWWTIRTKNGREVFYFIEHGVDCDGGEFSDEFEIVYNGFAIKALLDGIDKTFEEQIRAIYCDECNGIFTIADNVYHKVLRNVKKYLIKWGRDIT
jgi:hypothetical protein